MKEIIISSSQAEQTVFKFVKKYPVVLHFE